MTFQNKVIVVPRIASIVVATVSILILSVWIYSQGSPPPIIRDAKFNTAICLLMTSLAIWFMKDAPQRWNKGLITVGQVLCNLTILITLATLVEYAFHLDFNIDQLFVSDHTSSGKAFPGRMSPSTGISLLFMNFGLLILDHKPRRWRRIVSSTFLIPAAFFPFFAMIGYLYGEHSLYQFLPDIRMAWITSLNLIILSLGSLFCRPKEGPIRVLTSEEIGGMAARRLLPVVFILPMVMGFLVLTLVHKGYLDYPLGFALLIGFLIILLMTIIVYTCGRLNDLDTERLKLIDELELAVKGREELLSIASHEMKTPLTTLQLQTQIMQKFFNKEGSNEKLDKFLTQVEQQSKKLNRLIDDMLDVSRIRSGKFLLKKEEFDSCELVEELVSRLTPLFEKSGSGVPEITGCAHTRGCWDRMRIEQVLNNLFTNAIRYGEGKPIKVKIEDKGETALFSVQDFGPGIPEDKQEQIFNRFERAGMIKETSGLGLGLYITTQIVLAHHGKIWIESKVGYGSTFFVELPKKS